MSNASGTPNCHQYTPSSFGCAPKLVTPGRGDGPAAVSLVELKPSDFTTDTLVASRDWDAVYAKIRAGGDHVHGSLMPSWGTVLSSSDVVRAVARIVSISSAPTLRSSNGRKVSEDVRADLTKDGCAEDFLTTGNSGIKLSETAVEILTALRCILEKKLANLFKSLSPVPKGNPGE